METVERVTDKVKTVAVSARNNVAQVGGPSLILMGLVQVIAAFSPTTTIGHIAQGVAFVVIGVLVWEQKLKGRNNGDTT